MKSSTDVLLETRLKRIRESHQWSWWWTQGTLSLSPPKVGGHIPARTVCWTCRHCPVVSTTTENELETTATSHLALGHQISSLDQIQNSLLGHEIPDSQQSPASEPSMQFIEDVRERVPDVFVPRGRGESAGILLERGASAQKWTGAKIEAITRIGNAASRIHLSITLRSSSSQLPSYEVTACFVNREYEPVSLKLGSFGMDSTISGTPTSAKVARILRDFQINTSQLGLLIFDPRSRIEESFSDIAETLGINLECRKAFCAARMLNHLARNLIFGTEMKDAELEQQQTEEMDAQGGFWLAQGLTGKLHIILLWIAGSRERRRYLGIEFFDSERGTEWTTAFTMVKKCHSSRQKIDDLIQKEKENLPETVRQCELSSSDWTVIENYCSLFDVIWHASQRLKCNAGGLPHVLPLLGDLIQQISEREDSVEENHSMESRQEQTEFLRRAQVVRKTAEQYLQIAMACSPHLASTELSVEYGRPYLNKLCDRTGDQRKAVEEKVQVLSLELARPRQTPCLGQSGELSIIQCSQLGEQLSAGIGSDGLLAHSGGGTQILQLYATLIKANQQVDLLIACPTSSRDVDDNYPLGGFMTPPPGWGPRMTQAQSGDGITGEQEDTQRKKRKTVHS